MGPDYWMLDVDMDCSTAVNIGGVPWFEVKSFITNASDGWEPDVVQAGAPWVSGNHFAQCGKINIFERGSGAKRWSGCTELRRNSIPRQRASCVSWASSRPPGPVLLHAQH